MKTLNEEFCQKLSSEIALIEKESAVEIVPAIIKRSSSYNLYRVLYTFSSSLLVAVFLPALSWSFSKPWQVALCALLTLVVVYFLLGVPQLLLFLVPSFYKKVKVEGRAHKLFFEHELFATRDRSGLLVLVSVLEKSVFIFADKGFEGRISSQTWIDLSGKLAQDFSKHSPGDTFIAALDEMRGDLAKFFPVREGDKNELSNKLIIEER